MSRPLRAALYARVSTTGHGQDVELQLEELRQVAAQRHWDTVGEYIDDGASGRDRTRPALERLMGLARGGKVDVVAVWRFDRFARSTTHLLTALEEFKAGGVEFVSLREQIDTSTPMGKAMFAIVAAIGELERDLIQERVLAGVRRAQAAGTHCGRPPVPTSDEALVTAQRLLREGWSWRATSRAVGIKKDTLRRRFLDLDVPPDALRPPPGTPRRPEAELG
jgi:DNA invertase Pin-like site-specific DNA recombinase